MAVIQPGHNPIPCALWAGGGDAAGAHAAPAVRLAGAVVQGHQLAQHPHRVPLRALRAGDVGLLAVVVRVDLLHPAGLCGDQDLSVRAQLRREVPVLIEGAAKDVGQEHALPLVVVDVPHHGGAAGDDAQDEAVLRRGQAQLLPLQGDKAATRS